MKLRLFFDFDGVLVDLFDNKSELETTVDIIKLAQSFGLKNITSITPHPFLLWSNLRLLILDKGKNLIEFDQLVHKIIEKNELQLMEKNCIDIICVTTLNLAKNFTSDIAIISNNSKKAVETWLSKNKFLNHVNFVSGRSYRNPYGQLKPKPDLINLALTYFNCLPNEVYFFGDTITDFIASQKAGVHFIGVHSQHTKIATEKGMSEDLKKWQVGSRLELPQYISKEFLNFKLI